MKRATKICFITACSLVLIGCIFFAGLMSTLGWDFAKLSTAAYETNTTEITEAFRDISITSDTADIRFALSDDGICRVECREETKAKHAVMVKNGTLTVKINNQKSWYDHIGFHFGSPEITVYLPTTEYHALFIHESTGNVEIPGDFSLASADISLSTGNAIVDASVTESVMIRTGTGNIRVANTSVGTLDLSVTTGAIAVSDVTCKGDITVSVSTGKANLTNLSCRNVISNGTTGDITLDRVIAAHQFSIERSTGDVKFIGCDAAEIHVKTSTGNVTGSLLTDKVFITDTNTGHVDVPKTVTGGRCEIRTGTGDIRLQIKTE